MSPEANSLFPPDFRRSHDVAIDAGSRKRTYAELADEVASLGDWLAEQAAFNPGPVAVLTQDPWYAIPALLAALDTGVTYAPIALDWPPSRLATVAAALSPACVLVEPGIADDDPRLQAFGDVPRRRLGGATPPGATSSARVPSQSAAASTVFFTSGSTGEPKGIVGRPGSIAHFIAWERSLLYPSGLTGEPPRVSALAPCSFDASLRDALLPLSLGGTVCVPPDRATFADGGRLAGWLREARVHVVHTVPTVFRGLLSAPETPLPTLQAVLLAGEVLRPSDAAAFFARFGGRVALYNLYGPTETTMVKLWHRVTRGDVRAALDGAGSIPLGRPMPETEVFVLDSAGRPRAPGRPGEIVIRTPHCALGYLGRPDLTERAFVPNLLGDGSPVPVYRTGDLGVLREDGVLEFRGRRDHQVKVNGVRVELEEVEGALARIPGVTEAVAGLRDGSDGETRLVAWVVCAQGEAPTAGVIADALRMQLPPAFVPSRVVTVDRLPRLLNGKVDRAALVLPPTDVDHGPIVAPEGELETRTAAVIEEIVRVRVGATGDFFERGGDSLAALRAVWRLNEAFGVELPVDTLYRHRTARALAVALASLLGSITRERQARFTLTTLHDGASGAAAARTAVWFPPNYGLTLPYRLLAERLGGLSLGFDLQTGPCSVEDLGLEAVDAVRNLTGPLTLIGWSFGGILAFEVARRIAPDGVGVELVLLDSAAPGTPFDFAAGDAALADLALERIGALAGRKPPAEPTRWAGLTLDGMASQLLDLASEWGLPVTDGVRQEVARVLTTRRSTLAAFEAYRPAPWPGTALSVRCLANPIDWTAGWTPLITGGITRADVPGDHLDLMKPERLDALLAVLLRHREVLRAK